MAVRDIMLFQWNQFGNLVKTFDVFMAPTPAMGTASLAQTTGGGTNAVGVAGVRTRPNPSGVEQAENFGVWTSWPAVVARPSVTQFTFGAATGSNQVLRGHFEVYLF